MGFLGIGLIIGTVVAIGHFLVVMLPYAVLASTLAEKRDKDK